MLIGLPASRAPAPPRHSRTSRVALLCFEADERRCHRDVILRELHGRAGAAQD
ncbi:DUF488 family protein, N3 subclade [Paractinoplanes deccanensis]|uniref:DUF488 family protein, N3 subclade n=1 Tax=Paractinoplanes deccanensis TaxID=113561 RepID=UPI001943465E